MESCDLCMSARFGGIGHVQLFITLEDFCYGGKGLTGEGEIVLVDLVAITRFQPFVQTQPRNRRNHTLIILYIGIGIGRNSPQR